MKGHYKILAEIGPSMMFCSVQVSKLAPYASVKLSNET